MKSNIISIRQVNNYNEVALMMQWAIQENWNPGKFDALPYYQMDPTGFILFLLDDMPIGSISIVKYSKKYAFIGLIIILPQFRKRGYGAELWAYAMKTIKHMTCGLYAVPAQVNRYKRDGFNYSFKTYRWSKIIDNNIELSSENSDWAVHIDQLASYDMNFFNFSRKNFLKTMLQMPDTYSYLHFENTKITGYGIIRPCHEGFRLGPVYADSLLNAQIIIDKLITRVPNKTFLIVDMPSSNHYQEKLMDYFQFKRAPDIDTFAMIKNGDPNRFAQCFYNCYGVASLEIG